MLVSESRVRGWRCKKLSNRKNWEWSLIGYEILGVKQAVMIFVIKQGDEGGEILGYFIGVEPRGG